MFVTIVFMTPVSRRERPAKPALTQAGIVAAALRILTDEGLEKVTMRRVAQELDTGPASLYVYVANTAELHALMLDGLAAAIRLPAGLPAGDWQPAVVQVLTEYTLMLFRYPSLARSAMTLRPAGPNHLRLFDVLLTALRAGGLSRRTAAWGLDRLMQTATATACEHAAGETPGGAAQEKAVVAAAGAGGQDHPGIAWAGAELFSGSGRERLEWAFRMQLAGLLAADGSNVQPADTGDLQ